MSQAPQALYWYHQQPSAADYRNGSANSTGPWTSSIDPTGKPGVFKLVKYVPAAELAAEREKVAQLLAALKSAQTPLELYQAYGWSDRGGVIRQVGAAIAAAQPTAVKESLTAGQPADGDAVAQLAALREALRPFIGFSGHFEVHHQQAGGSASLHAKYSMTERQFATACQALVQLIGDRP